MSILEGFHGFYQCIIILSNPGGVRPLWQGVDRAGEPLPEQSRDDRKSDRVFEQQAGLDYLREKTEVFERGQKV